MTSPIDGEKLNLTVAVLNGEPSEELRILQTATAHAVERAAGAAPDARRYSRPTGIATPSAHLITSMRVASTPDHDLVRVWNRGGHAGELVMQKGDGALFAARHGLIDELVSGED